MNIGVFFKRTSKKHLSLDTDDADNADFSYPSTSAICVIRV